MDRTQLLDGSESFGGMQAAEGGGNGFWWFDVKSAGRGFPGKDQFVDRFKQGRSGSLMNWKGGFAGGGRESFWLGMHGSAGLAGG